MKKQTKIIAAFPGTGKSEAVKRNTNPQITMIDSDSSSYSWIEVNGGKVRNPEFPKNYIKHIKENIGVVDVIFVSSHEIVRKELNENNIEHTLIFPDIDCKDEYINRYKGRGNNKDFIDLLELKWEEWITDCYYSMGETCAGIKLYSNEYISDIL